MNQKLPDVSSLKSVTKSVSTPSEGSNLSYGDNNLLS